MTTRIITGDCREALRTLPDESVHCVVTSPPYWGLRDYGTGKDGIGLEETVTDHLAALVGVFAEVRRVLRKDGTLWLNYGDAYAGSWGAQSREGKDNVSLVSGEQVEAAPKRTGTGSRTRTPGCKPKDLIGLPWALAFALRADGWYLRQDIIWAKPNPMPESVTDRCTKAHEYLFLLSKSERYFYDNDAIREPASYNPSDTKFPDGWDTGEGGHGSFHRNGREAGKRTRDVGVGANARPSKAVPNKIKMDDHIDRRKVGFNQRWDASEAAGNVGATRNKRSVWEVPTAPFSDAHFATFPPALIEPCIKAGCPAGGTVLDPFGGAGTTGLVAERLGRNSILIELNPAYAAMAERRIRDDAPLLTRVAAE